MVHRHGDVIPHSQAKAMECLMLVVGVTSSEVRKLRKIQQDPQPGRKTGWPVQRFAFQTLIFNFSPLILRNSFGVWGKPLNQHLCKSIHWSFLGHKQLEIHTCVLSTQSSLSCSLVCCVFFGTLRSPGPQAVLCRPWGSLSRVSGCAGKWGSGTEPGVWEMTGRRWWQSGLELLQWRSHRVLGWRALCISWLFVYDY